MKMRGSCVAQSKVTIDRQKQEIEIKSSISGHRRISY